MPKSRFFTILVTEDSVEDFELIKIAIQESGFKGNIEWFKNGEELLGYFKNSEAFKVLKTRNKFISIIDINMPKKNGFEVLSEIKNDPKLKLIPCIMLTTSQSEEDIKKAYDLGANSFLTKPFELESMLELFKSIKSHWIDNSELPNLE
jgi:CheY-like chemotaxis protein